MIESGLRTILDNQKISISELSKLTNISRKTLTQLADNKSNGIKFNTLNSLVNVLGVNVNEILNFHADEKIKVSNVKLNSDNEITFKVTHINLATDKKASLPGKTTFAYHDETFIFTPPELTQEATDPHYRYAFSRLILNWRDSPISKPQEAQIDKDQELIRERIENAKNALTDGNNAEGATKAILNVMNGSQAIDQQLNDFSTQFLVQFCLELMKKRDKTIENLVSPDSTLIFVIHWKLYLEPTDKAKEIRHSTVMRSSQVVPYLFAGNF